MDIVVKWMESSPQGARRRLRGALIGAAACGAIIACAGGPHAAAAAPLPVIFMLAEFTGGWLALAISAALLMAVSLLISVSLTPLMLTAPAALLAAVVMRAALPAPLPVLALAAAGMGAVLLANDGAPPTPETVARVLLDACFNVALATLYVIARPPGWTWKPPLPRWRLSDLLFVGSVAAFAAAVLVQGWWSVAAILGVLAYGASTRTATMDLTERLSTRLREGRVRAARKRSGRLPRELALLYLAARRVSDGLHRRTAVQRLHLESARLRAGRLLQQQEAIERERRRLDLELQRALIAADEHNRGWQAFLHTVPEGLLLADATGRIEYANQGVQRLLGYEPEKLKGTRITTLIPAAQSGDPLELGALATAPLDAAPPAERKVRFTDVRGALHELSTRIQVFALDDGRRLGIRLREATGPLQRDQFVARMSHEIRTPLHGLMATLDMLRSEQLSAEGSRRLSIARTSAKTLMRIANDVLDLTRVSAGGMTIERRPMCIDRAISEVVDEARSSNDALPLHVRSEIIGTLPSAVLGDPGRIKQILRNLVSNALKFTTRGSVTVTAYWVDGVCTIEVIDTGPGIPADRRDSIFEAFVQAGNSRHKGGAGLGLAICRQLGEAMGGSLVLRQSSPRGSTFRLVLPLARTDETPQDDQSQRNLPAVRSRILVAEDDEASRYVAAALLDSLECPARVVANGLEALEILRTEEFDLILLDCEMPGLDGYEVTARIRSQGGRHVPIIAMTASTMAADRQRCFAAGMDDLLAKPFSRGALSDMLGKWLAPLASGRLTFAQELSTRPELDGEVFEELRRSLNWQIPPLRKIYLSIPDSAQKAIGALGSSVSVDLELAHRRLHSLQGGAGLVGARQIEFVAARLSKALKDEKSQELAEGVTLLQEALRRFEKVVNRRFDSLNAR